MRRGFDSEGLLVCRVLGFDPILASQQRQRGDPVAYVLSVNLHRRHLTLPQRAIVGARSKELYEQMAKERQGKRTDLDQDNIPDSGPESSGDSRDAAGAAVGVSGKSIDRAAKVITDGVPALTKAVDDGTIPITKAAEIADLPKSQQPKRVFLF